MSADTHCDHGNTAGTLPPITLNITGRLTLWGTLWAALLMATAPAGAQEEVKAPQERARQIVRAASVAVVLNVNIGTIRSLHGKISEVGSDYEKNQYRLQLRIHASTIARERFDSCQPALVQRLCGRIVMVARFPLSNPDNSWLMDCISYEADTLVGLSVIVNAHVRQKRLLDETFDPIEAEFLAKRAAGAPNCESQ